MKINNIIEFQNTENQCKNVYIKGNISLIQYYQTTRTKNNFI